MPPDALPLTPAYTFGISKGLGKEISDIRSLAIEWDSSYDSSVRRGFIIELFEQHQIYEEFIALHWPYGNSRSGETFRRRYLNIKKRFGDFHTKSSAKQEEISEMSFDESNKKQSTVAENLIELLTNDKGEIMSNIINRPAALVKQGNLKLYTTSLRVSDLLINNFYSIERLDPDNPDDKGYQRILNKGRAKKLADYLIEGQDSLDAFLPTSIFLATDKDIQFDSTVNTITFDVEKIGPFSVVDGQHRIEGLKMAAEKRPEIHSFEVPVNIAVGLPSIAQMCHFLIVNTTQKSVDKAVEQRIYARLSDAVDFEDVPNLPRWIQRIIESGDDEQALRIVDHLNETSESPWYGKIEMANQDSKTATINQKSFVKAIKKYVLTANNPISVRTPDQQKKIIHNYWKAIANLLDSGKPTVLFKYNGVELFSRFSTPIFNRLQNMGDYKTDTIEKLLKETFDNLEGDNIAVGHPEWWLSGTGPAGGLNATALNKINHELTKALHKAESSPDIEL